MKFFYSTRSKLILSFLGISILVGVVSLFAGIVMSNGKTLCRIGSVIIPGESQQAQNPIANYVLKLGISISGTVVLKILINSLIHSSRPKRLGMEQDLDLLYPTELSKDMAER